MSANTKINDLIERALRRQQRRNSEIRDILRSSIQAYVREDICTLFPFWFLRTDIGVDLLSSAGFPLTQDDVNGIPSVDIVGHPGVGYWLDRGILRTVPGQATYELFYPAETPTGDRDGAYWRGAKYQKPLSAFHITTKGSVEPEMSFKFGSVFQQGLRNFEEGKPCMATLESGRERDLIRFSPTPDKAYLIGVSWVLAEPLNYFLAEEDAVTENYTNKFMQEHEEVYALLCMLKTAEYFDDLPNIEFYKKNLFGEMNKNVGTVGGKIGDLKRSHIHKYIQPSSSVPVFKSNPLRNPSGHSDPWGRRGGGFYG